VGSHHRLKPVAFRYERADSREQAVALLEEFGSDARILAGGQSLVPQLNRRIVRPAVIVDITRASDLQGISTDGGRVRIGAVTTQLAVEESTEIGRVAPLLAQALAWVGSVPTKTRGTFGGSTAFADPAAEIPAALVALDAHLVAASTSGERVIPVEEFFVGPYANTLAPDELLAEVRFVALAPTTRTRFVEVARRRGGSRAIVGACGIVDAGDDGGWTMARLSLSGIAGTPIRMSSLEQQIVEGALRGDELRSAIVDACAELDPPSDVLAAAESRREIAAALLWRVLSDTGVRG
jgi:carbon-monoxide dehydrogenase medium subunit